ncbi:hypothetical protein AAHA92_02859 [Salvia divinorum]|uniref:Uncharacterized protein n=1 Tax=Salvia divinorum TaxID=28513 RepID=A0ABD1IFV0_SALDI
MVVPGAVEIVEHPQPLHAVEIEATPSPSAIPLAVWVARPRPEANPVASRWEADLAVMCGMKILLLCGG